MPYVIAINTMRISSQDAQRLIAEFDAIRAELTDIRAAYMALRAKLVNGDVIGAGYNTAATNLTTTAATATAPAARLSRT